MDRNSLKAILFDLDNTLIDTAGAGVVAIQKTSELLKTALGQNDHCTDDICDRFKRKLLHETFDSAEGRSIDEVRVKHWEESILEVVSSSYPSLGHKCYYLWKNTRLELLTLSPPVCNLLKELRTSYKLLLLTNGETQTQREKVEAVGCQGYFDAIVVGGEHAEEKPSPSIFTHCFTLLGVQALHCVMVGDSLYTDILGGFKAGVRATVWINNRGGSPPEGSVKPDYTISSVLELPDILAHFKQGS
ncbi:N-acylneuraminate-9-phosphatase [Osmerus eperlanus]|uniref:N-acylneuraminate-9-phosphatase n=1 Tax=Osmerus eperlanus TaxID=29151 RepID=UPI002E0FF68E